MSSIDKPSLPSALTLALFLFGLGLTSCRDKGENPHTFFSADREHAAAIACTANLKTIAGAKEIWMLENHKTTNDIPTEADLFGPGKLLQEAPKCLRGGTYTIGRVSEKPKCSFPGHTL